MNTVETVVTSVEATAAFGAVLFVAREALKRPWVKFSFTASFALLPPEKRDPAPAVAVTKVIPGTVVEQGRAA